MSGGAVYFLTRHASADGDFKREGRTCPRPDADELSLAKVSLVVNAVRGDPNFGDDSGLIEAMGYTRTSERKSGLTRKAGSSKPPAP